MKLQVRTALVLGIAAALFVSAAPNADAGGLLSKLFKCKKDEEPACCCPAPEPECPAPEPVCCEPEPEPAPVCCEPEPEPVCCEPAPEPEPVCCEPAPEPEPVCCEPEPEPAPCCAMMDGYPLPVLAEGEVLISMSPIVLPSNQAELPAKEELATTLEITPIVQIASIQ